MPLYGLDVREMLIAFNSRTDGEGPTPRDLLRVPWTARRSSQSILKEIDPEYSLEGTDPEAQILRPPDGKS